MKPVSNVFLRWINPQPYRLGYAEAPEGWLDAARLDYQSWFMALAPGMKMTLELDGRRVTLEGGQGLLVKPGTWLTRRLAGAGGRRYWVRFDWDAGHVPLAEGVPTQVYGTVAPEAGLVRTAPTWVPEALWETPLDLPEGFFERFERMNDQFWRGGVASRAVARGVWLELLLQLLAPCCAWEGRADAEGGAPEERLMAALREAALLPFNRAPSVEALLAGMGQSADHVARRFRRAYGVTPLAYLNRLRVEQAKALLALPGIGVSEVARRLGFGDFRYLSRLVRKVDGRSPREIRRGAQGSG